MKPTVLLSVFFLSSCANWRIVKTKSEALYCVPEADVALSNGELSYFDSEVFMTKPGCEEGEKYLAVKEKQLEKYLKNNPSATKYKDSVLKNKIMVGMPEELLYMSWGYPTRVNASSYGDQLVYGSQYVYIRNGRVTSWN